MKRRLIVLIPTSILIVLAAVAGMYFAWIKENKNPESVLAAQQVAYQDSETGVRINYPKKSVLKPLSETDKKDKFILRLTEEEGQLPFLITLRSESGLRVVASLTHVAIIDSLMRNSERLLPQRFSGYKEESKRQYEHNGRKAGEVIFTYDSPVKGERIKQRFVLLVKDDDTAVYLAMQSKEANFAQQNTKIFDAMATSVGFQ